MSGKYNSFYDKLSKTVKNMPTREEFNAYMDTDEGRRGLHSRLIQYGYLDDDISYEQWGKNLPRLNTTDTSKSYGVMASDAYTNRHTRQAEEQRIDQETKAEEAKNKQIADAYNAISKLEDTFAAYEQSQDVAELFPGAKSESSTEWRDRVAQRKEGEAQAKAKVDQEREELRQRMQLLKDNPDAYNELYGFKGFDVDKVNLDNLFTFDPTVDKRGNKHDNVFARAFANQRIDAEDKARQLGMQAQEMQEMLADPMALSKTMRDVEAEIERLGKARDEAAQKFSSENPFKAILFSTKGTRSLDPWLEGAYGPEAQAITLELEKAFAKLDNLKNIEKKIKSGELPRGGFWNGVGQMGQAVADKVTDRSWGMYEGMSNMLSESEKQIVFDKIAKGEPLTASEMQWATIDLLEGKVNTEVDSPYLYNITSGLMESAPYMRDIFLSPGKGISGAFVNWGKSRYGATGFLKLVGNALQGAATTATVGADELVSGTSERMRGDLSFGENGLEVTGQKSLGRALTQQFASQTASNMVELMGVPLLDKAGKYIGKAVKEVADGLSYGKVSKVLSAMDKSSAVNWVNGVRKSMGIHSLPAEIGEEYVDGFAQSIVEGEDQLSPMLNTEEFLNIAGTCGLMSAIFGSANVAGFAGEYHKINREYKKAKQEVLRQFSSDVWASLDNLITNAQDEDLTVRLADAMDGMAMNQEQRSAIMNYLTALKRYQKFNELNDGGKFIIGGPQAQATQSTSTSTYEIDSDITLKDEIGNPIDAHIVGRDANGNYMVESSQPINGKRVQPMSADQLDAMVIPNTPDGIQQSEVDGYNLTDANQQAEVSMLTDNARESVATLLGVTPDAVDVTLQQVLGDNPTDAKIDARFGDNAQVVKDYMYNVAKTKGMSARLIDDIADATAESDRAIDAVDNNGNVVTAKTHNDEQVHVVSGNINAWEDGQVNTNTSDSSVVIRHADGTTEMVAPTSLTEVVSMPTEQVKATQAQAITQQKQQAFADVMGGALDYTQGKQYTMLNQDGSTTDVTIVADNGDGNVTVTAKDGKVEGGVTDGKQIVLPKSQIQQGVREFKRNELRAQKAKQTSVPQAEVQPTEVAQPQQVDTTPRDEQGNVLYEQMDADSAWDALLAETGGDADMAMTVANEMIADKTKVVEEASKMVAEPGTTPQEKIANLKAVKQAQAQAQAELDAWKAIAETPNRRMSIAEEATTESVVESTPTESESTPQVGLVEDARTRTLGDKTRKMLDAMAKRLGLQVEFVDEIVTGKDEKGRNLYANAVIVGKNVKIAWHNRNRAIDFLLGHEFTHRMQDLSPEAYAEFVEATKQALGEEEWNKRINRMRDIYKSQGKTISEQGIINEVVADYAGELVEERGVFDNFVERNKNNRGLLSAIADVLRSIKEFFTLGKQRKIDNAIARLEALIESASEANLRGDVVNMEKERYSVSSIFEGTGATVFNEEGGANIDKDGNFYVIINGKQYDGNNLITLDDIKTDKRSVLNLMVEDAIKEGNVTEEHADVIMKKYVDIMNMFLVEGLAENGGYANMADKWMWVGETVYKTVQPNSDKQYTKSIDITTVCKKNEAVIRAMSEMQKRVGYGITPAQILDIYIETQQSGYQVPCPVCYVFSRYLRNGKYASGAILGMEQYGEHLPGGSGETWTADQWVAELRRLEKIDEDKANKALYNQASADIVEAETLIDKLGLRLQQSNSEAERKELRKQIEKADARYRAALNIFSQSALTSWIKTFAIQGSDDKGYKMRDDAQYPEDIELFKEHALDLRKAGETQTLFPAIQRLRNSGGSSTGKAVGFESNNALGDVISGIATGNNDTAYTRASKATTEKEFQTNRKKATENFKKASEYIKQQTLRGGQRMWSWSDNIEALMPDVVINLMQLELLGGALQTYSKQLEGVNLVARMGGYVNGSLMAKDNGYTEVTEDMIKVEDGKEVLAEDITETIQEPTVRGVEERTRVLAQAGSPVIEVDGKKYVLIFDDVIGIDPHGREVNGVHMKGLFDLNKELSKAGNIIVGMNDTHIRVGLADSRIFFIIPWHASGANNHILTEMFRVLGADISSMVSTDYTDMQSEKDYLKEKKDGSMPKIEQSVRDIWNAHKNETDWKCGIKGGIDSSKETISDSQKHYRELRQAIFDGKLIDNKAWLREVQADEFLSQVYDRVQSGTIGNSMTQEDNNHIYPYEYWDTSKTYDEADINGERYIEYCRRLGFSPKFSGVHGKKEYKNTGNFTNDKGYWKLLVDRRMYDIYGNFQDLDPVTSEDYTNELVHPGNTNKEFVISEVADAKATNKIVDRVIEKEVARTGSMPTVDYGMSHEDVYKNYKPEYDVMKADEVQAKAETKLAEAKQKLDTLVADGATKGRITTATKNVAKAEEALQQAKKAATSAEKKAQKSRFSLTDLTEEEQSIVDEAKANGTYLKAPNGKVSNLNERQWVQVRTKAFKDWFGDWELANLYNRALIAWNDKNSKGKVVVDLSEKAKARFKELLGKDISQFVITDDSIRHIKNNHGAREEFRGQKDMTPDDIVIIPYLVNNFDSMELNPRYDDKLGNRAIEITKRINGVSVVATIERGNNKEFLVTNYELVRSDALDASNETPGPNVRNDSDIAKVQKDIEDIKQKANNSSKIVDENGEPMVVYHGSYWNPLEEAEGKAVFKDSFRGTSSGDNGFFGRGHYFAFGHGNLSKAEARYYGSNVFDAFLNIRNPFMYVETIYKDYNPENGKSDHNASLIAINTAKAFPNLVEDFQVEQFDGNGDKVDSISIKDYAGIFDKVYKEKEFIVEKSDEYPNLIYVKADPVEHTNEDLNISWVEYGWEMRMVAPAEREDKQFIFAHHYLTQEVYGKEGHSFYILPERELNALSESEEFTSTLKERGYDGVLQSAIGDEAVAFEPTQIKSATDNVGTFDNANPDVRYSLQNKYGIKVGENIQIETIRDLFNEWNSNEELSELFDKVYDVASKLTFDIAFNKLENKKALGLYNAGAGLMELSVDLLTDAMKSQRKAQTILHELIHSVTTYAMYIDEYQELRDEFGNLAPNVKKAVDVLNEVYEEIKKDKIFKGEYGITNSKEMVAELANGRFRDKLKEKGLWQKVVEAIKELFGIATDTDTRFDKVNNALNDLLDNFDRSLWAQTASMGEKIFFDKGDVAEGEGQQMRYSLRTKPAPKKTIKVYKLFNVDENGNPQALFIDAANALEVGVWLDADSPNVKDLESLETEWLYLLDKDGNVVDKKPLKRGKAGNFVGLPSKAEVNDATQNNQRWMSVSTAKSGERAYHTIGINGAGGVSTYALRPGWHATNAPSARHIGVGKDGANAVYRGANQRWFEIEISADVDYNEEARERYLKAHPTYSREKAYSDLKGDIPERIPEDGYYNFKTNSNANPNQDWYIAGAIKIVRPLTEEEGRKISRSKGIAEDLPYKDGVKNFDDSEGNKQKVDNQGNPIDENGNLIIEEISSIDEITDNDFANPTRNIELPKIPQNVENAIGANGKPVIIKKNIFVKNKIRHPELSPEDGRNIFKRALYNPNLYGSSQPMTRPDYKVVIQTGAYNAIVVLDVYQYKENIEIIGWRLIDEKGLEKMKRQANREGGQFLILSPLEGSAAALSALPSDLSADKDNANSSDVQAKSGKDAKFSLQGGRSIADKYEKRVNTKGKGGAMHLSKFNFMEAWQDDMRALKEAQRIIEQEYGIVLESYEDAYMAENAMSSIAKASWDKYISEVYEPMMRIHDEWIRSGESNESINHYLIAKSGLERNREFTVRDALRAERASMEESIRDAYRSAINDLNEKYKPMELDLLNQYRSGAIDKDTYRNERKNLSDAKKAERKPIDDKYQLDMQDAHNKMTQVEEEYKAKRNALRDDLKAGNIDFAEFCRLSDDLALRYSGAEEIADYSGLTALAKMHGSKDWQGFAEQMVRDFEAKHSNTDVMWEHINNNTKSAVDYSYKSGVTSKQAKDHLDQMFLWYVPMKGNADVEAEDIYTYVNDKSSSFTPTVKSAKGHSEYVSEDIMALIANTMQSAILQGERNKVKQKFLNMVQNYPTDLFSVDNGWVELQGNDWVEVFPDINENDTPEEVRSKIEDFQEKMQELANEGKAKRKSEALSLGIPFRATQNKSEHAISVMRNGEKMTIYVNGNPRVAQAINGKLKDTKESLGMRLWHTFTRWLSAGMTGYSIDFTGANLSRDTHHSSAIMFLKYGFKEQIRYILNGFADLPALIRGISGKSGNTKRDAYFQEFLANGGETGYANLRSLDDWKVENKKRIGRLRTMGGRAWGHTRNVLPYIAEAFGYINRLAETSSRFNAYVRARERNQDVATAVSEAKNITVNFNKKGTNKTAGAFGTLANLYRETMMFANPIIQGLYQFLKVGKEHKGRFTVLCLGHVALGGVVPILNQMLFELLGGDDEDEYYNQSEYQRRTNLLIYTGHGYIKIPLAPIFRELYALGDVFYGVIQKKIKMEDGAKDVVSLVRSMFSIEGQSAIDDDWSLVRFILPEQLSFVADISDNVNFMGMPIYKDSDYLRFDPEYQKVYKNAWSPLVAASAKLNELLGGDEDSAPRNANDMWLNPAIWQHVISSIGGGPLKTIGDILDISDRAISGEGLSISNIPVAKRFFMKPDERTLINAVNREYYDIKEDMAWVEDRVRKFNRKEYSGYAGYAEKLDFMYHSPDYLKYAIFEEGNKEIEKLDKKIKEEVDEKEIENLKAMSATKKDQLIAKVNAVDRITETDSKDPLLAQYIGKDVAYKMRKRLKQAQIADVDNPGALSEYTQTPEFKIDMEIAAYVNQIAQIDYYLNDDLMRLLTGQSRVQLEATKASLRESLVELREAYEKRLKNKEEGEQ